jgi:hypothetical protein
MQIPETPATMPNPAREARLSADSDLWDRLEINQDVRRRIEDLTTAANSKTVPAKQQRLIRQLIEAQEALLCIDTRERHATAKRYEQIVAEIRTLHQRDPSKIADIDQTASFEGDSFLDKLIDICVSHNEPAEALVRRDRISNERTRFADDYPIGSVTADLHFVAAALRMADVLDFDRERTPAVLYYYLLPSTLDPAEDRSVLEWSKHLSISNWNIDANEIVFRGRCKNHIVHHGVVHFCEVISARLVARFTHHQNSISFACVYENMGGILRLSPNSELVSSRAFSSQTRLKSRLQCGSRFVEIHVKDSWRFMDLQVLYDWLTARIRVRPASEERE